MGVYLTSNLDWAEQVKYVSLDASQKLGGTKTSKISKQKYT